MPRTTVTMSLGADWLYLEVFYSHLICTCTVVAMLVDVCSGGLNVDGSRSAIQYALVSCHISHMRSDFLSFMMFVLALL